MWSSGDGRRGQSGRAGRSGRGRRAGGGLRLPLPVRLLTAALLAAGAALPGAAPAAAHATLVASDPADGAVLATAPSAVRLRFDEDVSPDFRRAGLVDGAGRPVAGAELVAASDPRRLTLRLPAVPAGTYAVVWQVLADDDGHTTRGVLVFSVGGPATPLRAGVAAGVRGAPAAGPGVPVSVVPRWLGLVLLAGAVGGLAVAGLVLDRARDRAGPGPLWTALDAARRRVLAVVAGCTVLAALLGLATLAAKAQVATGGAGGLGRFGRLGRLLGDTGWGHAWVLREGALLALAAIAVVLRSERPAAAARRRELWAGAAVAVLALVTAEALGGHAASVGSGSLRTALAVAATAAHVLAACCWLGAIPAVLLTGWAPLPAGAGRPEVLRACRGALTRLVLAAAATVLVTGLVLAGRQVGYPGGLTASGYGRALLVKGALLVALAGLGAVTAARLGPGRGRPGRAASRRALVAEAGVGLLVLLVAAVLLETAPPRDAVGAPARAVPAATASATVADLVVAVSASPGRPGTTGVTVRVASSRRPPPAPVGAVAVRPVPGSGAGAVPLAEIGDGRWFGVVPLATATGPVRAEVLVRRGGRQLVVPVSWVPSRPAPATGTRLSRVTDPLAAALLLAVLAVVAGRLLRRRSPPRPGPPAEPVEPAARTPDQVLEGSR